MKKTYIFYCLVTLFSLGFSQTIVTVDRDNIVGPTTSGSDASISSIGFTRGSGIALSNPGTSNHSSNLWDASTQAQALSNNDYIEWSTTAGASNNIEITGFDIRTRVDSDGPASWQIFYSLDNFSSTGIAFTPTQTSTPLANDFSLSGLSINSGTAGTITFRLYAWNAVDPNQYFRISPKPLWSAYGITTPGLRLIGNITTTATNSTNSDIVATSFDPSDNIDYKLYSATTGLTTSNAIKVGEFSIRDGGISASDIDGLPTDLTDITFTIANSSSVAALAIFDGATNISEASIVSDIATFSGITSLSAVDNSTKTFSVYATFNSTVTDNEQIQVTISAASADAAAGSSFQNFDAGAAQTPIVGDDNKMEVTATDIEFNQQPSDVNQFETMTPFPTIFAVDDNGNVDIDYSNNVSIQSSDGDMEPSTIIYPITNGIAELNTLVFTKREVVPYLTALEFGLGRFASSDTFNVNGPLITVAKQDFDGFAPEWTYTTDVTTFNNGWAIPGGGFYGVINSSSASPLDNAAFENNIFGENDLNDEGNGTSGFATLTFDAVDISTFDNTKLSFDWDIQGYDDNLDQAEYRLIYDGINQPWVYILNGFNGVPTDKGRIIEDIPNTVSLVGLQLRVRNDGENGYSGFDNFRLSSEFDGLIYIDNGSSAGWEPSAPSATTESQNAYVYSGTYNVGTNIKINGLYIRNGATTTVSSGQSIKTNSGIRNNGTLELNSVSTSYSSLITDRISGDVIYNRHVNQVANTGSTTGNNDLVSAPVTNASQTFLALRTVNSDLPSGTIEGVPSFLFGPFNNVTNSYVNYTAADDASLISPGIGYRTASTTPTGSVFKFVGNVETGSVAVPITVGSGSTFNLIGNPYPSYLSLSSFLASNGTKFNTSNSGVYGYKGDVLSGYTIWNQAFSDANPSAKIAPGQGFFVASKSGGATIDFTPEMRTIGTTDDFIVGRSENQNLAHLNIQVAKGNNAYQTALYFNDNASLSMDPGYDSELFEAIAPAFSIYSRLVEDNTGRNFAAQAVNYSALSNVTIPLGINIAQGEQGVVSIAESNIPEGTTVVLEDNVANTFTNLLEGDYTFTSATTLNNTGRFYLHFGQTTLGLNDNLLNGLEIFVNTNPKSIIVKGQLEGQTAFKLFDIQGRLVTTQSLNAENTEHSIDASNLTAGIYVVQLQNTTSNRTQKVIIR